MKYLITYEKKGPGGPARRLPDGDSIDTVSAMCRAAGVEFLEGAASGWGKRELAEWLSGSYHVAAVSSVIAAGSKSRLSPSWRPAPNGW